MDAIETRIAGLVSQVCGLAPGAFRLETALLSYGLDSVKAVDLVVSLEESFGIAISDQEIARFHTAADVVQLVRERTG